MKAKKPTNSYIITVYTITVSAILIAAGLIAGIRTGRGDAVFADLLKIMLSPSKSLTDYFGFGHIAAAYINAGLCGLAVIIPYILMKAELGAGAMTAYFLVIAHAFFGKNILNIWPCMIGCALFYKIRKIEVKKQWHVCCFTSCFGPMISEFLFRYTLDEFDAANPTVTPAAVALTVLCGLFVGFVFPFVLTFTGKISKGYNLYNAGLAGGVIGTVLCTLMFKLPGKTLYPAMPVDSADYELHGHSYFVFSCVVYGAVALVGLLMGREYNGKTFDGYGKLLHCKNGAFIDKFGMPQCLINLGTYGFYLLLIYITIIQLTPMLPPELVASAVGFTGPTAGAMFAALSFACTAQSPSNTWPIISGYVIYSLFSLAAFSNWTLSSQPFLCTMAFATGLCPIVQKRGKLWGIVAGIIAAALCTYPVKLHGGLMIYNSGFNAGLVAVIMVIIFAIIDSLKKKKVN